MFLQKNEQILIDVNFALRTIMVTTNSGNRNFGLRMLKLENMRTIKEALINVREVIKRGGVSCVLIKFMLTAKFLQ